MAASGGRKTSSSNKKTALAVSKGTGKPKTTAQKKKAQARQTAQDSALFHEIGLIVLFAVMVLLFCCNFGLIGSVGNTVSGFLFGVFGFMAYAAPLVLFLAAAFWFANEGNPNAMRKLIAGIVLFVMLGVICGLLAPDESAMENYSIGLLYEICRDGKYGGGILSGSLCFFLKKYLGLIGTVLVVILSFVICLILLTEKSLIDGLKKSGSKIQELSMEEAAKRRVSAGRRQEYAKQRREDMERRREETRIRHEEQERIRARKEEERRLRAEEKENEKILRMEKKVSGVMLDTSLQRPEETSRRDDMHEIILSEDVCEEMPLRQQPETVSHDEDPEIVIGQEETAIDPWEMQESPIRIHREGLEETTGIAADAADKAGDAEIVTGSALERLPKRDEPARKPTVAASPKETCERPEFTENPVSKEGAIPKKYMFPPITLLQKGEAATGDSARELKETAMHLQQTLATFGVRVTITDISQGPSVTRYELQPEQGVKVSKIVGLADDIKLNLAAMDIRIEAPIPGKAAIGIEVPNKESTSVALRDLLETEEFYKFPSKLAFAVGKDIAGKVIVADIAKMPHMLIAGATGSGKSVCINTLIMGILYKAHPEDVKLIMVDPKVVELSVYNGIPHLLIPVVTDPKKASAALHWGVAEMEDRYRKFAEHNVRDLKGYNKKIESMGEKGMPEGQEIPKKLPQIVIIVDELADLMMVCPGEVEESICRLAQLARAAGIHLIIATQRPSVDVITGLIKANMPSRVAFSVSSGVDSRTILDMVGAEKLLGKGDMLFYPQGYSKPARVQGAFVSDKEVSDVVDFMKNQMLGNTYAEDIEEKIRNMGNTAAGGGESGGSDVDELFEKAGRLMIDKDKASIGMLQRALQIGFNRAARIMDQLCSYGVVGEEEGTKPRKVLMSPEQFEQLLEEI